MDLSVTYFSNKPVPITGIYTPLNRSALVGLIRVMAVRNGGTGHDQVLVDGKSAYCMKKDNGKYEVIESHIANGKGGATCTQSTVFDTKKEVKKTGTR